MTPEALARVLADHQAIYRRLQQSWSQERQQFIATIKRAERDVIVAQAMRLELVAAHQRIKELEAALAALTPAPTQKCVGMDDCSEPPRYCEDCKNHGIITAMALANVATPPPPEPEGELVEACKKLRAHQTMDASRLMRG